MPIANSKNLIDSLRTGDLAAFKSSLRANPNAANSAQVVCTAAGVASIAALDLLKRNGADLNASYRNYRPLHAVIQREPHAERANDSGDTLSCLKWLLENGADPEQLGGWPATRAILTAAFAGSHEHVDLLRKAGAVFDGFVAAALGDVRYIAKALDEDACFASARDPANLTALHCAAGSRLGRDNKATRRGLVSIARLLLDRGAEVGATVRSWAHDVDAVYFAVSSDQREVFRLLLGHGANPDQALTPAVWRGATDFAELAMTFGGKLDRAIDDRKPLLNQMIRWGQFKQAFWMLKRGASPNLADERGWTAVHQAASRGNEKMLRALLEAGGNVQLRDQDGQTPLDIAQQRHRPKLVKLLSH